MFIKLDYSFFSAFDLQVKGAEILNFTLLFSEEKHDQEQETNYQLFFGKY